MGNNVEWVIPFCFAGNKLAGASLETLLSLILIDLCNWKGSIRSLLYVEMAVY